MRRKMNPFGKRLISILLTVSLLLQMLPGEMLAYAAELPDYENTLQISGDRVLAEVVGEVESLRQESEKHFRLSDGSYLAVSYGMPVHYLDEEENWQDIDNTMVLANSGNGTMAYRAANADTMSAFSASLSTGQLLVTQRDGYGVSMSLLDTSQARQMMQMTSDSTVTQVGPITGSNGNTAGLVYNRTAAAQLISCEGTEGDVDLYGLRTEDDTAGWTTDDIMPEKLTATILYEDVYEDVDIRYTAYSHNIKEEIIIWEPMSSYRFDFLLELDGLIAASNEDDSVSLKNSAGEELYHIPAPYMEDGAGELSGDVSYTLTQIDGDVVFTITADTQWINSPDRVFPVSIDPSLAVGAGSDESAGIYVAYGSGRNPDSISESYNRVNVGIRGNGKQYQTFMYVNYLPEIPVGAMVTGAVIGAELVSKTMKECTEFYVGLYEVTEDLLDSYDSYYEGISNLTWNNRPAFDSSNMIDFVPIHNSTVGEYVTWDMTELAKEWYLDDDVLNRTIALAHSGHDQQYSSTYNGYCIFRGYTEAHPPLMIVSYRNTVGMEPYYTYSSYYAGEAGMAYVADGTGQLKVVKELFTYESTVNPYTLSLVYNLDYFCNNNSTVYQVPDGLGLNMRLGSGWTLSAFQTVDIETISDVEYLRYHDGDGTQHYFAKDTEKDSSGTYYYDEDGLGLKIKSTGTDDYEMSDDQGNRWIFTDRFLTQILDADDNQINIVYADNKLTRITQKNKGATEVTIADFSYTEDDRVPVITDAAGNSYRFDYSGARTLDSISRNNTVIAQYTYFINWLTELKDVESGRMMVFDYNRGQISGYTEKALNASSSYQNGVCGSISYTDGSQTVYQDHGTDRTKGTADDIYTYYLFDYAGRTSSACTADDAGNLIGGTNAVYTGSGDTNKQNNRTLRTGSIGMMGMQLIRNSGFEVDPVTNPTSSRLWTMSSGGSISGTHVRTGLLALKGTISGSDVTATRPTESLKAGKTYTLSGYVKTTDMTAFSGDGVYLKVTGPSGGQWTSEGVDYVTSDLVENGWTRIHVTFTATADGAHTVAVCAGGSGTFYADDLQLEAGNAPTNRNMLENGGFDVASYGWSMTEDAVYSPYEGAYRVRIKGDPQTVNTSRAWQDVSVDLPGTETYVLSGWAWGNSVPDNDYDNEDPAYDMLKQFGLRAVLTYSDGTTENHYVPFDPDVSGLQFTSLTIVPKKSELTVSAIRVLCAYERNANETHFDNISLVREAAQTMKYDDDGNLISVTTSGLKEESGTYENGNLIQAVTGGYGTYTYTYDSTYTHRLTEVSNGVVKQTLSHDGSGNVTQTVLQGVNGGQKLTTTASYTDDDNRLASVTDATGQTVSYAYSGSVSQMTGQPTSVTDAMGITTTSAYDNRGRITQNSIADTVTLGYTYSKGLLDKITRTDDGGRSQTITFGYDVFGNSKAVYIGSLALATYQYATGNGQLTKQIYGNGDSVTFTYDNLQRITKTTYSDGRVLDYTYTGDGQIYMVVDNAGTGSTADDLRYTYSYDTLGRVVRCRVKEGTTVILTIHWQYDDAGRVQAQEWQMGTASYRETYTYRETDGSLVSITYDNGSTPEFAYTYDGLQRMTGVTTDHYTRSYTYRDVDGTNTTTQVSALTYSGDISKVYQYTYNALGYIATYQSTDESQVSYTYDNQGQLTQAVVNGGPTYSYAYDTAGNILTASDGSQTNTYSYDNTSWRDLLTAYNSQNIAYEGQSYNADTGAVTGTPTSGNPVSYYNGTRWTLDWAEGRNLISAEGTVSTNSAEEQDISVSYSYDADGLRTGKTVTVETYELVETVEEEPQSQQMEPVEELQSMEQEAEPEEIQESQEALPEESEETTPEETITVEETTAAEESTEEGPIESEPTEEASETETILEEPVIEEATEPESVEAPIQEETSAAEMSLEDLVEEENQTEETTEEEIAAEESSEEITEPETSAKVDEITEPEESAESEVPSETETTPEETTEEESVEESEATEEEIAVTESPVEEPTSEEPVVEEHSSEEAELISEEDIEPLAATKMLVSTHTEHHDYLYAGGKLLRDTITTTTGSNTTTEILDFRYDENGYPYSLIYTTGSTTTTYYYITNLQGDVMYLVDGNGSAVASYTYDPYGNILTATGSMAEKNPLRYRGYCYDEETGFYYLQSRYYDAEIARFINADSYLSTGQSFLGHNAFVYCGNNPVNRADADGDAWETVIDILSLGYSALEVIENPKDGWAWAGFAGDLLDLIPFVTGIGEATRAVSTMAEVADVMDDTVDAVTSTKKSLKAIKNAAESLPKGNNTVYVSFKGDTLEYVGITNDFVRRSGEWDGVRVIEEYVTGLDRTSARYVEQAVIDTFGMAPKGGVLSNKINSIGIRNPKYKGYRGFLSTIK